MSNYRSTKDVAATVRESLKRELPNWKFSVRVESYSGGSSIHLSLMQGKEEVLVGGTGYAQLNQYTFGNKGLNTYPWNNGAQLTPAGWEVMAEATKILGREHWDKSDAQIDYFNCAFYMHIEIGQWNKPYQVKGVAA